MPLVAVEGCDIQSELSYESSLSSLSKSREASLKLSSLHHPPSQYAAESPWHPKRLSLGVGRAGGTECFGLAQLQRSNLLPYWCHNISNQNVQLAWLGKLKIILIL